MYSNAQYYSDTNGNAAGIRVDINGITSFVPLDPANTDYLAIMKLVDEGELVISEAEEVSTE